MQKTCKMCGAILGSKQVTCEVCGSARILTKDKDKDKDKDKEPVYKKPTWAISQVQRLDKNGLVEDICKHGIGHPNEEWLEKHLEKYPEHASWIDIHGCDGCCNRCDWKNEE
jgi:uncharacterized Zn finger protein (UPF0148 family)